MPVQQLHPLVALACPPDLARATGYTEAAAAASSRLNRVLQLTGLSDPVYAEAVVTVHQYDIVLDVTVTNRWAAAAFGPTPAFTSAARHSVALRILHGLLGRPASQELPGPNTHPGPSNRQLACPPGSPSVPRRTSETMQALCLELATMGDLKLVERPQNYTLAPGDTKLIRANIKVWGPRGGRDAGHRLPDNTCCCYRGGWAAVVPSRL